jgi:hypothetical protein
MKRAASHNSQHPIAIDESPPEIIKITTKPTLEHKQIKSNQEHSFHAKEHNKSYSKN